MKYHEKRKQAGNSMREASVLDANGVEFGGGGVVPLPVFVGGGSRVVGWAGISTN